MSKVRLARRTAASERGFSRWIRGRPPTGRTLMRSLETSVTLGAMTTCDVLVLEVPGEAAHVGGGVERATGEEDDVGLGVDGDLRDGAATSPAAGCRSGSADRLCRAQG